MSSHRVLLKCPYCCERYGGPTVTAARDNFEAHLESCEHYEPVRYLRQMNYYRSGPDNERHTSDEH